jgi:rSAM/selenodomain-associated transferase 1
MKRHLVVFAKTPQPGRVKTRLTPRLSAEDAAGLARAFLLDVLALARRVPDADRVLAYTPRGTREEMGALAGPRFRLRVQQGRDLGERLARAFSSLLRRPDDRTVIIGSDSPLLPPSRLAEAFAALDRADVVLGPCEDGGYYLIGLRRWVPALLAGVRWSTDFAFADTITNANRLSLSRSVLESDYDVDDFRGLARLVQDLHALPPDRASHTRSELIRQGRWPEPR